jgi:molecular chaperone IbpA
MTGNFVFPRNAFLGFDHIFDALQDIHTHANDGYPPHNVVREEDNNKYVIEMAVAGFKKKDIEIEVKEHILTINGNRDKRREAEAYVHKGISARKFNKSFRLSEYTEVTGADLTDGILTVNLEVVLPKEKQPRKINIT